MKDIPLFTTENGAASLTLKEIPHRGKAYVTIQASLEPEKLLEECISFCRACGAEEIYATGSDDLQAYPLHNSILIMRGVPNLAEEKLSGIFPVTEQTVTRWREAYNARMRHVDNAQTLTAFDEKRILSSGGAYFVHNCGHVQGIGWLENGRLEAIASLEPGAGETVAHTIFSVCPGEPVELEVSSTNTRARRLYESLGLLPVAEKSRWYRVFP